MGRNSTSHQFDTFIGAASATVIAVAVAVPSTVIKRRKKFYSTLSADWSHFRAISGIFTHDRIQPVKAKAMACDGLVA